MEYFELILKNVNVEHLHQLLLITNIVDKGNLENSHFYIDNQDSDYRETLNFYDYYSKPATGMIKSGYANLGVQVDDVVTVISGCDLKVDIVINFKKIDSYDIKKISAWMESAIQFASQIVLGIEPIETAEEIIFTVEKN